MLVRAARLLGPRERGGRLLVQTFLPDHEVIRAAVLADPTRLLEPEAQRRHVLGLPAGVGTRRGQRRRAATRSPISCGPSPGSRSVAPPDDTWCGRPRGTTLGAALIATTRPKGARVRIAVDPPRV